MNLLLVVVLWHGGGKTTKARSLERQATNYSLGAYAPSGEDDDRFLAAVVQCCDNFLHYILNLFCNIAIA